MPEMQLVRIASGELRGLTPEDEKMFERFKKWWKGLGAGEFFRLKYTPPRNLKFHRKFFAMLNHAFEHWEPESGRKRMSYKGLVIEKNFEQFRKDVLVLAGYGEPAYDLQGRLHWNAKSIAFDKMEEDEFALVYNAVLDVLLKHILTNYTREDLERVVAQLQEFGS